MHTHTVFFWLKETTDDDTRRKFRKGLEHLLQDPHIKDYTIGTPANTDRDVVDNTYDFAIVVNFFTTQDHDAYQVGQHHADFLNICQAHWSQVKVYDIIS
ncbi:MAG: Dabb family protein [Pseudomonadota bacterium]